VAGGTLALGAALGIGWLIGKYDTPTLQAAPPVPAKTQTAQPSDYSRRVVAYINGTTPITREDLGEYLIARYVDKLDLLINKKIIEHACEKKGITVSAAEIEADFDLLANNVCGSRKAFIEKVLKEYRKTEYEWKEDVIRPRLMLTQFCKDRIEISEDDLQKAFESQYGEKVEVQIILYPGHFERQMGQLYEKVRQGEEAFNEEARKQPDPHLASALGRIKPIGRHAGLPEIEKTAFSLKPGQISHAIQVPEGFLIMRCVGRVPQAAGVTLDDKRKELRQKVLELKIQQEIPKVFSELKEKANPINVLRKDPVSRQEADRGTMQMLQPSVPK
jgi:hypothetical protein